MSAESFKRKLTAIMSADVKGYSRLMGEDEAETVKTLTAYRRIMGELIQQHRGRVIDSPGDNILAEFASVVDAVQCSVAAQNEFKARNAELPENRRMVFRIGVNLGDVIEEEGRIYGDGVNIAARLEALAEPGGICISKTAFDHIESKLPLGYQFLGEQTVKNIAKPVGAYKVLMEPRVTGAGRKGQTKGVPVWRRKPVLAGAVALLVVIMGAAVWNFHLRGPKIEPASKEKMALPLPDLPSIAVLPFVNMSDDPKQEFLSDGITEEIITALSKVRHIFVISRQSTFSYKSKPAKVKQVSEELGVRYVLEGSVQRSGDRIRINAQLIDALKGHHIWAERYDRELKDIFAMQDDITMKILTAIQVKLTEGEVVSGVEKYFKGKQGLECYLKVMEATKVLAAYNADATRTGRWIAEEALGMCPENSSVNLTMSWVHYLEYWFGLSKSPRESIEKGMELVQKALAIDDSSASAHARLSLFSSIKGEHDKAMTEGERAVTLMPGGALVQTNYGMSLLYGGRAEEAIPVFQKAIRLNPFESSCFHNLGHAYRVTGRLEEAVSEYKKALQRAPDNFFAHLGLAATYSMMGREQEARAEAAEVLRISPKFSVESYAKRLTFKDQSVTAKFSDALRKAGLSDKPPLPLPDKPSIAVLPFVNMSEDKSQEYFSDGLTEEIITALSKTPQIFVIASNTTFTYKGKPVKVTQVSEELGVRYVLEGSIRRDGERVRITAQLIDALKDHHLWSERYDRELKGLFSVQDDITKNIITAVHVKLTDGERARVFAKGTSDLEAYLKIAEAQWHLGRFTKESVLSAQRLAEEAIALDPNYAYAHMTLGAVHGYFLWLQMSPSPGDSLKRCIELMHKAVALDEASGEAHASLAYWLVMARQYDRGVAECERAMALDSNSDRVFHLCAATLMFAGKREEAIPLFREALRINPKPPNLYYRHFAAALRDSGRYDEAIDLMKKAIEQVPDDVLAYVVLASSCEMADREEEARVAAKEILRINPGFSLERLAKTSAHKDRAVVERFIEALRRAGLT
jgi:adenylate cyclase